mgnify:CR=1 FL=1
MKWGRAGWDVMGLGGVGWKWREGQKGVKG